MRLVGVGDKLSELVLCRISTFVVVITFWTGGKSTAMLSLLMSGI